MSEGSILPPHIFQQQQVLFIPRGRGKETLLMQSFILGQRSTLRVCTALWEVVLYFPLSPSLCAGSGDAHRCQLAETCKHQSHEALSPYRHMDIHRRKRRPRSYHPLCHESHCFCLKLHCRYRKMPLRASGMPMERGLLETIPQQPASS